MRVGTFAYPTSRGLGHLAKSFHDHGIITDVLRVLHNRVPNNDWYPGSPSVDLQSINPAACHNFVHGKDAMLFFETPFYWPILDYCKRLGVRTYLVPMYECTPRHLPALPHRFLCPSLLDMDYFSSRKSPPGGRNLFGDEEGVRGTRASFVQIPISYPWKLRRQANHFVHNGGYLGLRGREGTTLLIEAMRLTRNPIKLTLRVQENVREPHLSQALSHPWITYVPATVPHVDLYSEGDVAVMPQKFNGMSMPMLEAAASGMVVMASNRYPANTWLPAGPLIPVHSYHSASVGGAYLDFEEAVITPQDIAKTMDDWWGRDITDLSLWGKEWAIANSWEVLLPKWQSILSK